MLYPNLHEYSDGQVVSHHTELKLIQSYSKLAFTLIVGLSRVDLDQVRSGTVSIEEQDTL